MKIFIDVAATLYALFWISLICVIVYAGYWLFKLDNETEILPYDYTYLTKNSYDGCQALIDSKVDNDGKITIAEYKEIRFCIKQEQKIKARNAFKNAR